MVSCDVCISEIKFLVSNRRGFFLHQSLNLLEPKNSSKVMAPSSGNSDTELAQAGLNNLPFLNLNPNIVAFHDLSMYNILITFIDTLSFSLFSLDLVTQTHTQTD